MASSHPHKHMDGMGEICENIIIDMDFLRTQTLITANNALEKTPEIRVGRESIFTIYLQ